MKRLLKFLILMVLMNGLLISASSQSRSDSSVIANRDLRKAAIIIEQCNGCNTELKLKKAHIDSLEQTIKTKEGRISVVENNLKQQARNNQLSDENYKEQLRLKNEGIKNLENVVQKEKKKTLWISIALVLAVIISILK